MTHNWYRYALQRNGSSRTIIRPLPAGVARELGAELMPDFDPNHRLAEVLGDCLIATFPPEGGLERSYPLAAEIPGGHV